MIKRAVSLLFLVPVIFFSGCSKQPQEEMSTVRPNLILNIFKLIKQGKHDEAIVQVQKLRELDPTNSLLPVLEDAEKNNRDIRKINMILRSKKDNTEIIPLLKSIDKRSGFKDKTYRKTTEKLHDMLRMQALIETIISPSPKFDNHKTFHPASKVLKDSIDEFDRLARRWNAPSSLRKKVQLRRKNISRLQKEEQLRAVQSLGLLAPGLESSSYQTMMALSLYAEENGTKKK